MKVSKCKFCGSERFQFEELEQNRHRVRVVCSNCWARGPERSDVDRAVVCWNELHDDDDSHTDEPHTDEPHADQHGDQVGPDHPIHSVTKWKPLPGVPRSWFSDGQWLLLGWKHTIPQKFALACWDAQEDFFVLDNGDKIYAETGDDTVRPKHWPSHYLIIPSFNGGIAVPQWIAEEMTSGFQDAAETVTRAAKDWIKALLQAKGGPDKNLTSEPGGPQKPPPAQFSPSSREGIDWKFTVDDREPRDGDYIFECAHCGGPYETRLHKTGVARHPILSATTWIGGWRIDISADEDNRLLIECRTPTGANYISVHFGDHQLAKHVVHTALLTVGAELPELLHNQEFEYADNWDE